jgi:sugar phosphate isomerase/epimerase
MIADRIVSLAAGTVLDVDPATTVDVAAASGFDAAGLWFDPMTWTDATTRQVAKRLAATGIIALDIEPVILGRGQDVGERMIAVAGELDVRFMLLASGPAPANEVADRFAELCDFAAGVAPKLCITLEFLPIFTVGTLQSAVEMVERVARPNAGVLIDTLHLARSGGHPDDLLAVDRRWLPYLQLADAPAAAPDSPEAWREEAMHGRLLPGDGVLPIRQVIDLVPGVPLSVELRSRPLMVRYPDPVERATAVLAATRRAMA